MKFLRFCIVDMAEMCVDCSGERVEVQMTWGLTGSENRFRFADGMDQFIW